MQTQKPTSLLGLIMIKERRAPLIRQGKIQPPIAVNISQSNAFADHGFGEAEFGADIIVTSIGSAHKERIQIMAAEIRAQFEIRPKPGIRNDATDRGDEGWALP